MSRPQATGVEFQLRARTVLLLMGAYNLPWVWVHMGHVMVGIKVKLCPPPTQCSDGSLCSLTLITDKQLAHSNIRAESSWHVTSWTVYGKPRTKIVVHDDRKKVNLKWFFWTIDISTDLGCNAMRSLLATFDSGKMISWPGNGSKECLIEVWRE